MQPSGECEIGATPGLWWGLTVEEMNSDELHYMISTARRCTFSGVVQVFQRSLEKCVLHYA